MSFLREVERFQRENLNTVKTTVTTVEGKKFLEYTSKDGQELISVETSDVGLGFCEDNKPDTGVYHVVDKLFISSQDGAQNLDELKSKNITHILNVATGVENAFPKEFFYKTVALLDLSETDVKVHCDEMFKFIDEGCESGKVLVHCNAGVSRSATVLLAYLMSSKRVKLKEAMDILKAVRPSVKPNEGFLKQLVCYEKELGLT